MKKILKIVGIVIIVLVVAMFAFRSYTKSHSPAETVSYGETLSVEYSRPFKKGRVIFGPKDSEGKTVALEPYGDVWRTGANEATIFTTKTPILFGGQKLDAGSYSLFTIPNETSWTVILNSETGQWGVTFDEVANRKPELDVVTIETPVIESKQMFEQFTIEIKQLHDNEVEMSLSWDHTQVAVPISILE